MRQNSAPSRLPIASIVWLAALGWIVGPRPAAASDYPYLGVVTAGTVDVRAGAGKNYYKAGELRRGDVVQVHNHFHQWFKIAPPPGVYSYVKSAFVVRSGDGATGTLTRDDVIVKTAALDGPPGLSYRQQRFLRKSEQVFIVAEIGDFYKILPPDGAYVFLPPGVVVQATAEQVAAAGLQDGSPPASSPQKSGSPPTVSPPKVSPPKSPPTVAAKPPAPVVSEGHTEMTPVPMSPRRAAGTSRQMAVPVQEPAAPTIAAVEPVVPEPVATAMQTPAPADADDSTVSQQVASVQPDPQKTEDHLQAVRELTAESRAASGNASMTIEPKSPLVILAERRLQFASLHPLHKQPLEQLMQSYKDLSRDKDLSRSDRHLVRTRMLQLVRRQHLAATLQDVSSFLKDLRRPSGDTNPGTPVPPPHYAAVGQLVASVVYDGQTLPIMYRVVEPGSFRTLAYVRPGNDGHAARCLGKLVGVIGEPRFDGSVKALVVDAVRVDLLEPVEDAHATQAGRCVVGSITGRRI